MIPAFPNVTPLVRHRYRLNKFLQNLVKLKDKKIIALLAIIMLLAILLPQHSAKANTYGAGAGGKNPLPAIGSIVTTVINSIANFILHALGAAVRFFADLLDQFIRYQTNDGIYGLAFVDQSWAIIRDFVNMFFILVLIIMAFGTILGFEKYSWRVLLVPFIIAALLVNFSLVIGQYIITVANGLSGVFLGQIKQAGGISSNFATGTGIANIMSSGATDILTGTGGVVITAIFAIIFLVIVMLAFAATAIFSIVRLFFLWFLLIISPIAWLGYTLPSLRKQTWSDWWTQFLCWCFFLPYFLFFVMFAVIFIKNRTNIPPIPSNDTTAGLTTTAIMIYALSLIFLVGGMIVAKKLACASGTGIKAVFGGIEKGVRKYAPGSAFVRSIGAGAKEGLKAKGEELKEKGVPLGFGFRFGGEQASRLRQARVAEFLGVKGAGSKTQSEEVDKEFKKLQSLNLDQAALLTKMQNSKGVERVAALKLRAENGWLNPADLDEINNTMRDLGGGRSVAGSALLQSLKKGKFHEMAASTVAKENIFNGLTDVETKKAFGLDMAESRELMSETLAKKLLDIYAGDTAETRKKVEEAVKNNIENFSSTKDKASRQATIYNPDTDPRIKKLVGQVMVEKKEVDNWKLRKSIIDANGGMDPVTGDALTASGRELAKNMKDNNVAVKEEADYRKANPAIGYTRDLNLTEYASLENQIISNIKSGLITSFSAEELKTPVIFNALYNGKNAGTLTSLEFRKVIGIGGKGGKGKPDRRKREAANALVTATAPMPYP